ncbi:MAG: uroporphyrinogen decarboxylase family protein [Anaerolineae bacterium]
MTLTSRERFIAALERRPLAGRVPHFELVFFLTMEAFGKVHPSQRSYLQWDQMSESERSLHRAEMARLYVQTAERYEHDAIFIHPNPNTLDETFRLIDSIRDLSADRYFIMMHGDATFAIPNGEEMLDWCAWLYDDMQRALDVAQRRVDTMLEKSAALCQHGGLDGFALCSDYCLNTGPFLSPSMFRKVVSPYLRRLVQGQRDLGFYVIKHTDGNIMPILEELVAAGPHALHSIDPQAGVDLAHVKRLVGDRVALIGNVNCGLLTSGSDEEVVADVRRSLAQGMPGFGYIFSTSNCVYTGMPLERYDLMLDVWKAEGNYTGNEPN